MLDSRETSVDRSRAQSARSIVRRRGIPNSRAVVGGLLVAVSMAGAYAASTATGGQEPRFLVAARALTPGQHLVAADLESEPMRLPQSMAGGLAFRNVSSVLGAVVVAPLRSGELLQAGDIVSSTGGRESREISIPIDASRALDGELSPGDRVDVLATYGSGVGAATMAVAKNTTVVSVSRSTSLGASAGLIVTLSIATPSEVLAVANAVDAGEVILARSTGDTRGAYPSSVVAHPGAGGGV